jgi:glycosyltransferase involved in cell wall biosynthesis
MTDAPFFSVVTVCRNAAHVLEVTASSLRSQTFTDYEWVVVDGASTDRTCDVARRYIDPHHDTLISEPDGGVYFAMNKGLRLARGQFVLFLNAGDRFAAAETLTTVHSAIDDSVDVLHGDVVFLTARGDMIPRSSKHAAEGIDRRLLASHQSVYVRRSTHLRIPFDTSLRISADFKALAMLHAAGARFRYLPEPLSITTLEDSSISVRGRAPMAWEDFGINRRIRGMPWPQAFSLLVKTRIKISVIWTLKRLPELVFQRIPPRVRKRIY